ncbi:MAG: uncharacterized protein QOG53_1956 [Frankiales bacterium]|nr:uncharacterized protein [Frankiales bacterium]
MSVDGLSGDLLVGAAGFVAGAVNAIAGGGTLVSFPALLAVGNSALTANITNSVGLLAGYLGGSVAYRPELQGQRHRVVRLGLAGVVGGVGGALLLVYTPSDAFRALVPYLVLFACALVAVQPRLAQWVAKRRGERRVGVDDVPIGAFIAVMLGGVYGAYFGGALGVVLLAVFGILLDDGLQRLNALKGVISLIVNGVAVVIFLFSGHIAWVDAAILAVTAYAGATLGVRIARRLSETVLRIAVIVFGTAVAGILIATG